MGPCGMVHVALVIEEEFFFEFLVECFDFQFGFMFPGDNATT